MSILRLWWITAAALLSGSGCASYSATSALPVPACQQSCDSQACDTAARFSKPHYASSRRPLRSASFATQQLDPHHSHTLINSVTPTATPLPVVVSSAPYEIVYPATESTFAADTISVQENSPFEWDQADGRDIICRAATHAAVANAIAAQRKLFRNCDSDSCSREHVDELFRLAEARERQLAAEKAASLLVNAARLQCQQALLHEVRREIHKILDTQEKLAELQPDAADTYALRLQLIELEEQQATLTARHIELQARLRQLLALPPDEHRPLRIVSLPNWVTISHSENLVQTALENRPDLQATRQLAKIDTLGLNIDLSSQMAGIHPLLAVRLLAEASETPLLDFLKGDSSASDPNCEPQIQGGNLEQEQTRDITAEVTTIEGELLRCEQRISALESRLQLLTLTKQKLEDELAIGRVNYQRWVEASLAGLEARGELIDAVSDLHVELAKLETATGLIAADCGSEVSSLEMVSNAMDDAPQPSIIRGAPGKARKASATLQRLAELQSRRSQKRTMSTAPMSVVDKVADAEELPETNSILVSHTAIARSDKDFSHSEISHSEISHSEISQSEISHSEISQSVPPDDDYSDVESDGRSSSTEEDGRDEMQEQRRATYVAPQASLGAIRPISMEASDPKSSQLQADEATSVVRRAPSGSGPRRLRLSPMPAESPVLTVPNR